MIQDIPLSVIAPTILVPNNLAPAILSTSHISPGPFGDGNFGQSHFGAGSVFDRHFLFIIFGGGHFDAGQFVTDRSYLHIGLHIDKLNLVLTEIC